MFGKRFCPRIRGLHRQWIYRIDPDKDYGPLDPVDPLQMGRERWLAPRIEILLLILAAIIYWQIREIDRVLSEAGSDADDLNFELLSHISPIGWDNVLLYGEYRLNRSLVRSERLSV